MRPSRVIALSAAIPLLATFSARAGELFEIPAGLKARKPGTYDLVVRLSDFDHAKEGGVRSALTIPRTIPSDSLSRRPVVVFFHGSTKNQRLYARVPYMVKRATKNKFVLLSVQNWWSLSGGHLSGADDSRKAANIIVNRLVAAGVLNATAVYTAGFSAGGLTAMAVALNSLDEPTYADRFKGDGAKDKEKYVFAYAGFASFKGNYYPTAVSVPPLPDDKGGGLHAHYQKLFAGKLAFLTVGGKRDAARVQVQAPEAKEFLSGYLGLPVVFKAFPSEGHSFGESNWTPFWRIVEERLTSTQ